MIPKAKPNSDQNCSSMCHIVSTRKRVDLFFFFFLSPVQGNIVIQLIDNSATLTYIFVTVPTFSVYKTLVLVGDIYWHNYIMDNWIRLWWLNLIEIWMTASNLLSLHNHVYCNLSGIISINYCISLLVHLLSSLVIIENVC